MAKLIFLILYALGIKEEKPGAGTVVQWVTYNACKNSPSASALAFHMTNADSAPGSSPATAPIWGVNQMEHLYLTFSVTLPSKSTSKSTSKYLLSLL